MVDYKTGESTSVGEGDAQIHSYAAFMVAGGARWTRKWRGRLVNVRDGSETEFGITMEGIHDAYARIESDIRRWRLLQTDPERNVAPMDAFPLTGQRDRFCPSCQFLEVCTLLRKPWDGSGGVCSPGGGANAEREVEVVHLQSGAFSPAGKLDFGSEAVAG